MISWIPVWKLGLKVHNKVSFVLRLCCSILLLQTITHSFKSRYKYEFKKNKNQIGIPHFVEGYPNESPKECVSGIFYFACISWSQSLCYLYLFL